MDPFGGGGDLMTPEQLQAIMEYAANQGTFDEQERMIQQQLAEANALRNRPRAQHTTGIGAALGGLGDVVNAWTGARQANYANEEDKLLQLARAAALRKRAAAVSPQPLPGYDTASGSLADPMGGGAYIMPGSLYR